MATARVENFGKLLEPGLRKIFYEVYKQIDTKIPMLFNVQTTDKPYETDVSIGTMGEFPKFTGSVEYDTPVQGYTKVYEFPEYAKGFAIERKLFDDDQYNIINRRPEGLAISAARSREQHAAKLFINAFSNSYAGGDGVALCSTTHPSKAADGPAARSNAGTSELSHDSLVATRRLMKQFTDDRGGKILLNPDTLLVPLELEEMAWMLNGSDKLINVADNDPNFNKSRFNVVVWDYLPDGAWFMMDSYYMKMFLNWFDRIPLEFAQDEEFDTLIANFRAYMRYEAGWSDWMWIYGHDYS